VHENRKVVQEGNPELGEILASRKANRIQTLHKELKLDIELIKDEKLPAERFKVFSADEDMDITELYGIAKNK